MTDPTGFCFVSYRRIRLAEVGELVGVLHDHGIPTWQDVSDLPTSPTEEELRRVLAADETASAVLFVTPEVETSAVIREIEAPEIVGRCKRRDGFFAVPVAAGSLDYGDVARVLGPHVELAHLPGWNIHKPARNPIDHESAVAIAEVVLRQRLAEIHRVLPADAPLRASISTRGPAPRLVGPALVIDLSHRFAGRLAPSHAWADTILPALRSIVRCVRTYAPGRSVELSGLAAIPAAMAAGAAFLSLAGVQVRWVQDQTTFGKPAEQWGLHRAREASGFQIETSAREAGAADLALLVSVAADVRPDFSVVAPDLPDLRAVVSIAPPPAVAGARTFLGPGQAVDLANVIVDALRSARATYHCRGTIHVFFAGPVGLAMMIGQLMNTFGPVQTYEHLPGSPKPYVPAALLAPSL